MNTNSYPTEVMKKQRRDTRCSNRHLKFPTGAAEPLGLAVLLAVVSSGYGQVVSIDFKDANGAAPVAFDDDGGTAFMPGQAGEWNVLDVASAAPAGMAVTGALLDGTGQPSSVSFTLNGGGNTFAFYDTGDADNLCRDLVYLAPTTSPRIEWEIGGLKPNATYNLAFYAQKQNGVFNNPGVVTIGTESRTNHDGTAVTRGVLFGNPGASESPHSVAADANGKIVGSFSFYEGKGASGFSAWSGLQIVATEQIVKPTSSTPTLVPGSTVYAGTPVTASVLASGTPPLSYQWRLNGGSITSATDASYNFKSDVSAQGNLDVVMTSPYGAVTSAPVVLTVYPASAPILTTDVAPASALSPVGGMATFTASYEGTLPIAYQWQVDNGQGFNDIEGATNATLLLQDLRVNQAGLYRLTVSNALGQGPAITAAELGVNTNVTLAVFTSPNSGQGLDLEGNFEVAEYYGGTAAGALQLGDAAFLASGRVLGTGFEANAPTFGSTLADRNLSQILDSVVYGKTLDVVLDNLEAGASYKLQLLLHEVYHGNAGARVMAVNISGIDVVTNLDLVAMGANMKQPKGVVLTYEFTSDGSPLLIPIVAISDNASINGLTLENKSRPSAPVVVSVPGNQTVYAGNAVELAPVISGSSPKTYQWQIGTNDVFVNLQESARFAGATNSILKLSDATPADSAHYRLIISNAAGSVTSAPPTQLIVFQRPVRQLINVGVQANFRGQAVLGLAPDAWNVVGGGVVNSANLIDVTGAPTDVTFSIRGVSGSGNFGDGELPLTPETDGLLGYYDYVANGAMTVTLSGLDSTTTYDLVVFSAGNGLGQSASLSGAISGTNTLTTRSAFVEGDNYARNRTANSDPSGNIVFQVANDPNQTPYGTFNGLQIQNNRVEVKLRVVISGGSLILTWPEGKLLESTTADGPFSLVPANPVSPYTVSPSANQKFYRVQVSP